MDGQKLVLRINKYGTDKYQNAIFKNSFLMHGMRW